MSSALLPPQCRQRRLTITNNIDNGHIIGIANEAIYALLFHRHIFSLQLSQQQQQQPIVICKQQSLAL